jgi:orotate phosphoribosyltransferase
MRDFIRLELARVIAEMYPDADIVAGVATNAIAHGVLVAQQLSLPFVYVHPQPKDHGLENQIEGDLRPRQSVVIIENQVNSGINCTKVVEAIRNNGCKVLGIVTIFDYGFAATKRKLDKLDVSLTALTNFETVIRHAVAMGLIDNEQQITIENWQHNPAKWGK